MRLVARKKTLVQQIAAESAKHVLSESTRAAIPKMAQEFAREMRAEPEYREHIRREATAAAREVVAALRAVSPELHGSRER
jgi:hypothetical protein